MSIESGGVKDITEYSNNGDVEVAEYECRDDVQLEQLGYKQEFKRDFSFLGVFSLCSSELAVLPGVAGTIWYVLEKLLSPESELISGWDFSGTRWDTCELI